MRKRDRSALDPLWVEFLQTGRRRRVQRLLAGLALLVGCAAVVVAAYWALGAWLEGISDLLRPRIGR